MNKGFNSICVKDILIEEHHAHVTPIYATSTFTYADLDAAFAYFRGESKQHTYARMSNPTTDAVAEKIALLEGYDDENPIKTYGLLFGSGMAAIATAILTCVKSGDTVVTQANLYGTTNEFLTKKLNDYQVNTIYADLNDVDVLDNLLQNNSSIKLVYIETPANPTLACYNIKELTAIAKQHNAFVIVDNTFATPYLQRPLFDAVDIVVHSSTKFLNGHGTGLSGVLVCKDKEIYQKAHGILKTFGGIISPFEAYLLNNGVKTLPLRMEQHMKNAIILANFLNNHAKVKKVNYLGLTSHQDHHWILQQMKGYGGMLSFEIDTDIDGCIRFLKQIKFCTNTGSLGTADTLITHPCSTSHSNVPEAQRLAVGITPSLVRVSVGLENIEDVITDINQALAVV
ncbi:MAG: aminotransferase class I/II-fold pyridoxal phosphate-dependent enzyme [Chitinophagales bacterium]|nr:aminotransferase class I/II-fold pyridoxal phosphate-dependent enzyme [Chitinophagales bacterium]